MGTGAASRRSLDTRALQDWLGQRNITHTVRYTELSPTRFKDFLARLTATTPTTRHIPCTVQIFLGI